MKDILNNDLVQKINDRIELQATTYIEIYDNLQSRLEYFKSANFPAYNTIINQHYNTYEHIIKNINHVRANNKDLSSFHQKFQKIFNFSSGNDNSKISHISKLLIANDKDLNYLFSINDKFEFATIQSLLLHENVNNFSYAHIRHYINYYFFINRPRDIQQSNDLLRETKKTLEDFKNYKQTTTNKINKQVYTAVAVKYWKDSQCATVWTSIGLCALILLMTALPLFLISELNQITKFNPTQLTIILTLGSSPYIYLYVSLIKIVMTSINSVKHINQKISLHKVYESMKLNEKFDPEMTKYIHEGIFKIFDTGPSKEISINAFFEMLKKFKP